MNRFFNCIKSIEDCVDELMEDVSVDVERLENIECSAETKAEIMMIVKSIRRTLEEFK